MYKICKSCNKEKLKQEFHSNGTTTRGTKKYKPICKECTNKNSGLIKQSKIKQVLSSLNRDYACELCGYNKNYAALCFHHVDSLHKSFAISEKSWTASISSLQLEIDKCVVLCANCHAEVHNPTLENSV